MKFRSTHPSQPLSFEFAGRQYDVPVGGTVEIEAKWLPWIISRGLMLEEAVDEPAPAPTKEPVTAPRKSKRDAD